MLALPDSQSFREKIKYPVESEQNIEESKAKESKENSQVNIFQVQHECSMSFCSVTIKSNRKHIAVT
jgi:hypothetical protein